MSRASLLPIIIAAVLAFGTAVVGGTITVLDEWYYSLQQPDWAPPGYMFGVIWTAIFALIAIAGVLGWEKAPTRRDAEVMLGMFAFNGFLNLLWSFLFFRMQRPDWAFYELILLWISIAGLIVFCGRFSKLSSVLLVPYLVWVTIAGALNYQVVQLNGPFG
ncbi:TspO/MBR family protein [Qipengyuania sp. DSG2-2]|uniref:TspO/MBR family protein n=1 Tax=Qipengyuania sp. DGS2-2 TaxID=3349631 RepID=UPI0036D2DA6D